MCDHPKKQLIHCITQTKDVELYVDGEPASLALVLELLEQHQYMVDYEPKGERGKEVYRLDRIE